MSLEFQVLEHFRKHLGTEEAVVHTNGSIDVLLWPDPDEVDVVMLLTVGMSKIPMTVPKGQPSFSAIPRVELFMYAQRRDVGLLATLLCDLTAYPAKHDTFIHWSHVIALGLGVVPDSELTVAYFQFPPIESDGFATLEVDGQRIDVLWVVPISAAERKVFEVRGADALEELLEANEVQTADLTRRSVA